MQHFTDTAGRRWALVVTIPAARRVQEAVPGVNLLDIYDAKLWERLYVDPQTLVAVLYALLDPQIQRLDLSPEAFAEGLAGDVLDAAADALTQAIIDFFPNRQRPALQKARETTLAQIERMTAATVRVTESPEMQRMLKATIDDAEKKARATLAPSGTPFSTLPVDSESTLPPPY
jgi:hypothetical protein